MFSIVSNPYFPGKMKIVHGRFVCRYRRPYFSHLDVWSELFRSWFSVDKIQCVLFLSSFFLTINASRTLSVVNYVVAFNGSNSRNVTLVRSECRRAELRNCWSWSEKEKVISAILRARQQHKLNLSANFTDLDQFYFRTANENSGANPRLTIGIIPF